jgi:hypothetical protein
MSKFAKIRSMYVRPSESADLSFNTAGIISFRNRNGGARLGSRVQKFDMSQLISRFSEVSQGNPETLSFDANSIRDAINPKLLFALTNDILDAALRQSIKQREISYLQKYKHVERISKALSEIYPTQSSATSKLGRLYEVRQSSDTRQAELAAAYKSTHGFNSVVKEVLSSTDTTGDQVTTTRVTPVTFRQSDYVIQVYADGGYSSHNVDSVHTVPQIAVGNGTWTDLNGGPKSFESQETKTQNNVNQKTTTIAQEFKHPSMEAIIRDQRLQLDLQDEIFAHSVMSYRVPEVSKIFEKELEVIDLEIRKIQLQYFQTFLLPPISGIITAIYKDEGEAVQPGEAVIRIENDEELLLIALVACPFGLKIGMDIRIQTANVFESNDRLTLDGRIVSVRGHDPNDNEWDIIVEAKNNGLPINYHFDRDNTTFEIG